MPFLRRRRRSVATPEPATTRAEIARGWNGLSWGTLIAEFEARFSRASGQTGGWWTTDVGPEEFCGIVMEARYAFNSRGELYLVAFYPGAGDRDRLAVAAMNELGPPDGTGMRWTIGEVEADVKVAGTVATLTHRRLATE